MPRIVILSIPDAREDDDIPEQPDELATTLQRFFGDIAVTVQVHLPTEELERQINSALAAEQPPVVQDEPNLSWKTTLADAVNSCELLDVDGYDIVGDGISVGLLSVYLRLPDDHETRLTFDQQDITVDVTGSTQVADQQGQQHTLTFQMLRRMVPEDVVSS